MSLLAPRYRGRRLPPLTVAVIAVALLVGWWRERPRAPPPSAVSVEAPEASALVAAVRARRSDIPVETDAVVAKLLPDDTNPPRHQRFLVRVPGLPDLLVAHNIDLAPRAPVQPGRRVRVKGEYAWNDRGGVIHWTHRDPANRREGGWVEINGRKYQ